jgi:hypothetical protein
VQRNWLLHIIFLTQKTSPLTQNFKPIYSPDKMYSIMTDDMTLVLTTQDYDFHQGLLDVLVFRKIRMLTTSLNLYALVRTYSPQTEESFSRR